MAWVIGALAALAVYLVLSMPEKPKPETVEERLKRVVALRGMEALATRSLPGAPLDSEQEPQPARPSPREALVGLVEKATSGRRLEGKLTRRLNRAGSRFRPAEFLVAQGLAAAAAGLVGLMVAPGFWWLLGLGGWILPSLLLKRAEAKRQKLFDQQLPDALGIIGNALRSGYSFLQAMDVVSREMPDPIAGEFGLVLRETRVNIPLETSLHSLVERVGSQDVDLMVTAVLIQRQVGGNLAEVIDRIAETIKERIRLQGEIRTLTTQGRLSGWVVSLLPVALALLFQVISPGFLSPLFHHPVGWAMIGIGVVMQGIGITIIRKMVNMEV